MKAKFKIVATLACSLASFVAYPQIFAQSGYEAGKDGILLLETPCKDEADAGFKIAILRSDGVVMGGCYVQNRRQNFVVKWENGKIEELPKTFFKFPQKDNTQGVEPSVFETTLCDYHNLAQKIILSGRCHMHKTDFSGNFGYILIWPSGERVEIQYINSQSGNHIWKINGESAVAIEISRQHVRGFSTDFNQFIEWQN